MTVQRWLAAILVVLCGGAVAQAKEVVLVGGYEFAPFVETHGGEQPSGVTLDLIRLLNGSQDDYEFRFVLTSPTRRYRDFEAGRFDMLLFESPDWGWTARRLPVEASAEFLSGGEVYIAPAMPGRGQDYFADLRGKRIAGILGYHYAMADFEADPAVLRGRYNMTLVNSNEASIALVLSRRVDAAIVTIAYLKRFLRGDPDAAAKLLVSARLDQTYSHRALVRAGGRPSAAEMSALLARLEREGALARLWRDSGIGD